MPVYHLKDNMSPTSEMSGTGSKIGGIGHLSDQMRQSLERTRGNSKCSSRGGAPDLGVTGVGASILVNGLRSFDETNLRPCTDTSDNAPVKQTRDGVKQLD